MANIAKLPELLRRKVDAKIFDSRVAPQGVPRTLARPEWT
jgi:hypothetical protein